MYVFPQRRCSQAEWSQASASSALGLLPQNDCWSKNNTHFSTSIKKKKSDLLNNLTKYNISTDMYLTFTKCDWLYSLLTYFSLTSFVKDLRLCRVLSTICWFSPTGRDAVLTIMATERSSPAEKAHKIINQGLTQTCKSASQNAPPIKVWYTNTSRTLL